MAATDSDLRQAQTAALLYVSPTARVLKTLFSSLIAGLFYALMLYMGLYSIETIRLWFDIENTAILLVLFGLVCGAMVLLTFRIARSLRMSHEASKSGVLFENKKAEIMPS